MEEYGPTYQPEHAGAPRRGRFRKDAPASEPMMTPSEHRVTAALERTIDERIDLGLQEIERQAAALMREVAAEVWRAGATDTRPEQPKAGLGFVGRLRPWQSDAVQAVLPHDRGVIVAPPGAGKTVMACAVIAHHDRPTLVLVDREPLVGQWRNRLCEHLGSRRPSSWRGRAPRARPRAARARRSPRRTPSLR